LGLLDLFDTPNRHLHTSQGRWISPDPLGMGVVHLSNPQSWNLYTYVLNNPLTLLDPDGLDCVYLNDEGNRAESIDHIGKADECWAHGGYWANGFVGDGSWVSTSSNSDITVIKSYVDGFLAQTIAGSNNNGSNAFSYGPYGDASTVSLQLDVSVGIPALSISADRRNWFERKGAEINNWMMKSPTMATVGCIAAPPGYVQGLRQDIASLKGRGSSPSDSSEGGGEAVGYGYKIFMPGYPNQRGARFAPFVDPANAKTANGYALGVEYGKHGIDCMSER
jgi:RHS repeat-associated protein